MLNPSPRNSWRSTLSDSGDSCIGHRIALHNSLIGFASANNAVTLDGENLLKDVGGAECFERPDLHLTGNAGHQTEPYRPMAAE